MNGTETQVNMHEAKSTLSSLGELVWKGHRMLIAQAHAEGLDLITADGAFAPNGIKTVDASR